MNDALYLHPDRRWAAILLALAATTLTLPGCYAMRGSSGGGQTGFSPPRTIDPADVALPPGYRIEAVATGLTFPTGVAFGDRGRTFIVESGYSYGEAWTEPRLLEVRHEASRA